MKKILCLLIFFALMFSLVTAQGPKGIHEPGTGIEQPELREAGQGTGQGMEGGAAVQTTAAEAEPVQISVGEQQQTQARIRAGEYVAENGKQIQVQEQAGNRIQLRAGNVAAHTSMEMMQEKVQEKTRLKVKLSNGRNAEVKIMPDTASERALERLRLKVCSTDNNCTIELKEVGQGEQVRAAYEVQAQKQSKVLGLFKKQMQVQAQVDAENGEVIRTKKPWWAFLASEPAE
jgi:hypothetical protein